MIQGRRYWKRQFDIVMTTNEQYAVRCAGLVRENNGLYERIAELEAENERTRWHYPDKGELPSRECGVLFVLDSPLYNGYIWRGAYENGFFCDFVVEYKCDPERVTRWKYLD